MIGAIAGDIIGSVYEWQNIKTKQFDLFRPDCSLHRRHSLDRCPSRFDLDANRLCFAGTDGRFVLFSFERPET